MSRTVLVTGGARGIGAAVVRVFAAKGWKTAINYKNSEEQARGLAALIRENGGEAEAFCADVADCAQAAELVRAVQRRFGRIDALVNNAGIAHFGFFADTSFAERRAVIATDLEGTMNCTHAVIDGMLSRKSGRIVNIASVWGQTGGSCEAVYSAAKAGVIGFTKALAKELGPMGINVNCVAPGFIDTQMNGRLSPEERAEFIEEIPLRRAGTPADAAQSVYFLCSSAADYITGQVISPNGGQYI